MASSHTLRPRDDSQIGSPERFPHLRCVLGIPFLDQHLLHPTHVPLAALLSVCATQSHNPLQSVGLHILRHLTRAPGEGKGVVANASGHSRSPTVEKTPRPRREVSRAVRKCINHVYKRTNSLDGLAEIGVRNTKENETP